MEIDWEKPDNNFRGSIISLEDPIGLEEDQNGLKEAQNDLEEAQNGLENVDIDSGKAPQPLQGNYVTQRIF